MGVKLWVWVWVWGCECLRFVGSKGATVKAGMEERRMEVMWFHKGNYDAGSHDQR